MQACRWRALINRDFIIITTYTFQNPLGCILKYNLCPIH